MAIDACYEGACVGAQATGLAMVAGAAANLARIPLAAALATTRGVPGVWIAIAATTVLKAPLKWLCFERAAAKRR
jgi:Na+-driven multidrug efflux pump